jgi:hypothetical protein
MDPAPLNLTAPEALVGAADRARVLLATASSLGLAFGQRCKVGLSYKDGPYGAHAVRFLPEAAAALADMRRDAEADLAWALFGRTAEGDRLAAFAALKPRGA